MCAEHTLIYPATGQAHPHAVTSTTGTPALTLTYDANGNLATQGTSTYAFDAENRLKTRTVTGGTVAYLYDAQGTLLKRTNAHGSWTAYVGGIYEVTNTAVVTKYYGAYGRAVAMRKAGTISYLLSDHLGSATAITDATGAVVSTQAYWPYGSPRLQTGTLATDKQFTAQQVEPGDSALGLYDYRARFYSTVLGRFVSADPVVGHAYDPQSWNPYTYVRNNPMRLIDPSGLEPVCLIVCTGSPDQIVVEDGRCGPQCAGALQFIAAVQQDPDAFLNWIYADVGAAWEEAGVPLHCGLSCGTPSEIDSIIDWANQQYANVFDLVGKCGLVLPGCAIGISATACINGSTAGCVKTGIGTGLVVLPEAAFLARLRIVGGVGSREALPLEVNQALDDIAIGKQNFAKDFEIFNNREGLLPAKPQGYYRAYTAATTAGPRGVQRIVIGSGGETYYSPDHYQSFFPIR